ncbi:MAG: hypothetical protein KIT31_09000 [Deltaproteobacteria bacterium]|nr:hypothetical protein [Deltaproteobacteria bacterium]
MKLRTFVLVFLAASTAGVFGLYLACRSSDKPQEQAKADPPKKSEPPKEDPPPPPKKKEEPTPVPVPVKADADDKSDLAARPHDAEVLAWQDKSLPGEKVKDTSKGKPYKIAVYRDAGKTTVNRAKVDLNRNGKDDEKYTFEPGKITLQRAPADDEKFTETYRWNGRGWTRK